MIKTVPRCQHQNLTITLRELRERSSRSPWAVAPDRLDGYRIGLDCLDGTALLDIKPYFASTDAVPDAVVGWHAAQKS